MHKKQNHNVHNVHVYNHLSMRMQFCDSECVCASITLGHVCRTWLHFCQHSDLPPCVYL